MSNVSGVIYELNDTINTFESKVDVHVQNIHRSSTDIDRMTQNVYDKILEFRKSMENGEQKQLAHENIIRIDQIIKEQFSNHETIRRTVMGVVRDFDINLVRNSTIQELSEELWITSSRYWLSYALIAITAWVNNYPDVAKSALGECGRKDAHQNHAVLLSAQPAVRKNGDGQALVPGVLQNAGSDHASAGDGRHAAGVFERRFRTG